MAKSKLVITDEIIEEIKHILEDSPGTTYQDLCDYFGIKKTTWFEKIKNFPEISEYIKRAKAKSGIIARKKLWNYIEHGGKSGLTALIFYLKTQHGWSDKRIIEIENEQVSIQQIDYEIKTLDVIEASKQYQKIMEK